MKKPVLGQGLSALINQSAATDICQINCSDIALNPYQPRKNFNENKMQELVLSIKANGIITPITVRKLSHNKFELIAGERRLRACQIAQIDTIPAYILSVSNSTSCEMSILENTQREDLSPIEEAMGYDNLIKNFEYTQEKISERTGKSRSHIANILRILQLPQDIHEMIHDGRISLGHAKVLLQSKNPIHDAEMIYKNQTSVREFEKILKNSLNKYSHTDMAKKFNQKIQEAEKASLFGVTTQKKTEITFATQENVSESDQQELERIEHFIKDKTEIDAKISTNGEKFLITLECKNIIDMQRLMKILSSGSLKNF